MTRDQVLERLQALADPNATKNAGRYAIHSAVIYNVGAPALQALAREIGRDHALALDLWASGIYDARLLAAMIADPDQIDDALREAWAADFDNWAIVDTVCGYLFNHTAGAYDKALEWSAREEEFVKRAGFVLMVTLAIHDKKAPDDRLLPFLPVIQREATDSRNFVRKAVNWALRQIGKRSLALNAAAITTAEAIAQLDNRTARWIASDALRELRSDAVQNRLARTPKRR